MGPGTIAPLSSNVFNYGPLNYFQRPDERYTAGVFANYEINPAIKPYLEFMFMDDHTVAQIAPSGDFGNTLTINCDNPLMSAAQRTEICAIRKPDQRVPREPSRLRPAPDTTRTRAMLLSLLRRAAATPITRRTSSFFGVTWKAATGRRT